MYIKRTHHNGFTLLGIKTFKLINKVAFFETFDNKVFLKCYENEDIFEDGTPKELFGNMPVKVGMEVVCYEGVDFKDDAVNAEIEKIISDGFIG